MYQVVALRFGSWCYGAIHDTLDMATWDIRYLYDNHDAVVVDLTTGEIVFEV